jgi:hypothetical protein
VRHPVPHVSSDWRARVRGRFPAEHAGQSIFTQARLSATAHGFASGRFRLCSAAHAQPQNGPKPREVSSSSRQRMRIRCSDFRAANPIADTHIWRCVRVLLQQPAKNAAHVLLWFRVHTHAREFLQVLSPSLITFAFA